MQTPFSFCFFKAPFQTVESVKSVHAWTDIVMLKNPMPVVSNQMYSFMVWHSSSSPVKYTLIIDDVQYFQAAAVRKRKQKNVVN